MSKKDRIDQQLDFLKIIDKFKLIERRTHVSSFRLENNAEHSWHVAMFAILFEKEFPDLDLAKILKMALIHDLVEIYAGDTFTFDDEARKNKKAKEEIAAKRLFNKLPNDLKKQFSDLFYEYEERKTQEAKVVQYFDKMQPLLQSIISQGKALKENGLTERIVHLNKKDYLDNNPIFKNIYHKLMTDAKNNNIFAKG